MTLGTALLLVFVAAYSPSLAAVAPLPDLVMPQRFEVHFSRSCSPNAWIAAVASRRPGISLQLSVMPEFDISGNLLGWQVALVNLRAPDKNLLEPRGNWHGLQAYDLMATDFRQGPERSAFGRSRRIDLPEKGVLVIAVAKAVVSDSGEGISVFDDLVLDLSIESTP